MKKIILIIYLTVLSVVAVYAQSATSASTTNVSSGADNLVEVADEAVQVSIKPLNQEYPSKQIGFQLTITSKYDSGRTAVEWFYPTSLYNIVGDSKDNVTVTTNQTTSITKYFLPIIINGEQTNILSFGIGVKVSVLTYEKNYLTIIKRNFIIDNQYQLLPLTDYYREAKTEYEVTRMLIILGIVAIVMFLVSFGLGRLVKYVNSDDKES